MYPGEVGELVLVLVALGLVALLVAGGVPSP